MNDFFGSGGWPIIRNLSIFFVVVFWLAIGYWVYKDARRRIEDPWLVAMATVLGLVPPFLGVLVYMLFRPPEYLEDVHERELEIKAMEERLSHGDTALPRLPRGGRSELPRLPVCTTRLRQACEKCKAPLEALWQVCPYCETPIDAAPRSISAALAPSRAGSRAGRPSRLRASVAVERTLVLVKPDAMQRALAGEILGRFERRGLKVVAASCTWTATSPRSTTPSTREAVLRRARRVHHVRPDARARRRGRGRDRDVRTTMGATNPADAAPGSIRGDLALAMPDNLVHGSDSPESAEREIALWFPHELADELPSTRDNREQKANAEYTDRRAAEAWARDDIAWGIRRARGRAGRPRRRRGLGRRRARLRHGVFLARLAKRGARPVGSTTAGTARDRAAHAGRPASEFPLVEAAEDVPLPDKSFDLAFSITARRSGPTRSSGSLRRRGCCGRVAGSSS